MNVNFLTTLLVLLLLLVQALAGAGFPSVNQ